MLDRIKKIISIVISITLLSQNAAYTSPQSIVNSPQSFYIPEQYGRVENSVNCKLLNVNSSKLPKVILVKDAHCNYEAQKNIARILDILIKDYKIDLVGVEGASGKVDPSVIANSTDAKRRKDVSDKYLKKGWLTASEALAMERGKEYGFSIYGAEDLKLYLNNLKTFREVFKENAEAERFIKICDTLTNNLKSKLYTPSALSFDKKVREYETNTLSLTEFILYLHKQIPLTKNYKNLNLVLRAIKLEKSIDFSKVEKERAELIKQCEKKLPKEEIQQLVQKSLLYKLGKISSLEYYTYLTRLYRNFLFKVPLTRAPHVLSPMGRGKGEGLSAHCEPRRGEAIPNPSPNLQRYTRNIKLHFKIDENGLFKELANFTEDIYAKYTNNEISKKLHDVDKRISLMSKLSRLEITRDDLMKCREENNRPSKIAEFLKIQAGANNINIPNELTDNNFMPKIENFCKQPEEFYKYALERDNALVNNMLAKMDDTGKKTSALVVGGFHADGIEKLLKGKNIQVITIVPSITKEDAESKKIYLSRMMDERINPDEMMREFGLNNLGPVPITWPGIQQTFMHVISTIENESLRTALQTSLKEAGAPEDFVLSIGKVIVEIKEGKYVTSEERGPVLDILQRLEKQAVRSDQFTPEGDQADTRGGANVKPVTETAPNLGESKPPEKGQVPGQPELVPAGTARDNEDDINIADIGLRGAPHKLVNKIIEYAFAKYLTEGKKLRGRDVYMLGNDNTKNMYELALLVFGVRNEDELIEKAKELHMDIKITDVKALKEQHGHAGIEKNNIYVVRGASKDEQKLNNLILHEIMELELWQIKAVEIWRKEHSGEAKTLDITARIEAKRGKGAQLYWNDLIDEERKQAKDTLRKWITANPDDAKTLAQKFHDAAEREVKLINMAQQEVESKFADVAFIVGTTMRLSKKTIQRILRETRLMTIRSKKQSSASLSGLITLALHTKLDSEQDVTNFYGTIASEFGHRPHQILIPESAGGVNEAFDRTSCLTLLVLLGRLTVADIKDLAFDAFIGEQFIKFMETKNRKSKILKKEENSEFLEFLANAALNKGIEKEDIVYIVEKAQIDLWSADLGQATYAGKPSHMLGAYIVLRLMGIQNSTDIIKNPVLAQEIIRDRKTIINLAGIMGKAINSTKVVDFTEETSFLKSVGQLQIAEGNTLIKMIKQIINLVNWLRVAIRVRRINGDIKNPNLAHIVKTAHRSPSVEESSLSQFDLALLLEADELVVNAINGQLEEAKLAIEAILGLGGGKLDLKIQRPLLSGKISQIADRNEPRETIGQLLLEKSLHSLHDGWVITRGPGGGARKSLVDTDVSLDGYDEANLRAHINRSYLRPEKPEIRKENINGLDIEYAIVYYDKSDTAGKIFNKIKIGGAYHLESNTGSTKYYIFLDKTLSDKEKGLALQHEKLEIYWKKTLESKGTCGFSLQRAAHILAWAQQIQQMKSQGWQKVEDVTYLKDQLDNNMNEAELQNIYDENEIQRGRHHKLISDNLGKSVLPDIKKFEESVRSYAKLRIQALQTQTAHVIEQRKQPITYKPIGEELTLLEQIYGNMVAYDGADESIEAVLHQVGKGSYLPLIKRTLEREASDVRRVRRLQNSKIDFRALIEMLKKYLAKNENMKEEQKRFIYLLLVDLAGITKNVRVCYYNFSKCCYYEFNSEVLEILYKAISGYPGMLLRNCADTILLTFDDTIEGAGEADLSQAGMIKISVGKHKNKGRKSLLNTFYHEITHKVIVSRSIHDTQLIFPIKAWKKAALEMGFSKVLLKRDQPGQLPLIIDIANSGFDCLTQAELKSLSYGQWLRQEGDKYVGYYSSEKQRKFFDDCVRDLGRADITNVEFRKDTEDRTKMGQTWHSMHEVLAYAAAAYLVESEPRASGFLITPTVARLGGADIDTDRGFQDSKRNINSWRNLFSILEAVLFSFTDETGQAMIYYAKGRKLEARPLTNEQVAKINKKRNEFKLLPLAMQTTDLTASATPAMTTSVELAIDGVGNDISHMEGLKLKNGEVGLNVKRSWYNSDQKIDLSKGNIEDYKQEARKNCMIKENIPLKNRKSLEVIYDLEGKDVEAVKKAFNEQVNAMPEDEQNKLSSLIVVSLLQGSTHLFEDHKQNGFIGINEQLFNEKISFGLREKLLKLGFRHELKHEAGMGNSKKGEDDLLKEDMKYAKELGITALYLLKANILDTSASLITNLRIKTKKWEETISDKTAQGARLRIIRDTTGIFSSNNETVQVVETEASQALSDLGLNPNEYVVVIADSDAVNAAFYFQEGEKVIEFNRGLISFLSRNDILNRDTIKFVLGHESGHSLIEKKKKEDPDYKPSGIAAEYQADEYGLFSLDRGDSHTGYSPISALKFMEALKKEGATAKIVITTTHPHGHRRQVKIYNDIRHNYWSNLGGEPMQIDETLMDIPRTGRHYFDEALYDNFSLKNIQDMVTKAGSLQDIQKTVNMLNIMLEYRTILEELKDPSGTGISFNNDDLSADLVNSIVDNIFGSHEGIYVEHVEKYIRNEKINPTDYIGIDRVSALKDLFMKHCSAKSYQFNEERFDHFLFNYLARIILRKQPIIKNAISPSKNLLLPFSIQHPLRNYKEEEMYDNGERSPAKFWMRKQSIFNQLCGGFYTELYKKTEQLIPELQNLTLRDKARLINLFFAGGIKYLEEKYADNRREDIFKGLVFEEPVKVLAVIFTYFRIFTNEYLENTNKNEWAKRLLNIEREMVSFHDMNNSVKYTHSLCEHVIKQIAANSRDYTLEDILILYKSFLEHKYTIPKIIDNYMLREQEYGQEIFEMLLGKISTFSEFEKMEVELSDLVEDEILRIQPGVEEIKVMERLISTIGKDSFRHSMESLFKMPHTRKLFFDYLGNFLHHAVDNLKINPEELIATMDDMLAVNDLEKYWTYKDYRIASLSTDIPKQYSGCYAYLIGKLADEALQLKLIGKYCKKYNHEFRYWNNGGPTELNMEILTHDYLVVVLLGILTKKGLAEKDKFIYLVENGYLPHDSVVKGITSQKEREEIFDLLKNRKENYLQNRVPENDYNNFVSFLAWEWFFEKEHIPEYTTKTEARLQMSGGVTMNETIIKEQRPVSTLIEMIARLVPSSENEWRIRRFIDRFDMANLSENDLNILFDLLEKLIFSRWNYEIKRDRIVKISLDKFKDATGEARQEYIKEKDGYVSFYYGNSEDVEKVFTLKLGKLVMERWLSLHNKQLDNRTWDINEKISLILKCFPLKSYYRNKLLINLCGSPFEANPVDLENIYSYLEESSIKDQIAKRILLDKHKKGLLDVSSYKKVKEIIEKYFTQECAISKEMFDLFLQDAEVTLDELKEYKGEKVLTEVSRSTKKKFLHILLEYIADDIENKPEADKRELFEWLCGVTREKPAIVQYYEYVYRLNLDELKVYISNESTEQRYAFVGTLFVGPKGILNKPEEKKLLLQNIFGYGTGEAPAEGNTLFLIFSELFNVCPEMKQLDLVHGIFEHFMKQGATGKSGRNQLIKSFLMSFGVVGVKLGQILSNKPELVKDSELRAVLADCSDKVEPLSKQYVLNALLYDNNFDELKGKIKSVGRLLGSASIKQGYIVTMADGSQMALKYVRPLAHYEVTENMDVLRKVLDALKGKISRLEDFSDTLIDEVEEAVNRELDMQKEVSNQKTISSYANGYTANGWHVVIPKIEEGLKGKQFFADSYCQGKPLKGEMMQELRASGELENVCRVLVKSIFKQIFIAGRYHADLHPGNILIDRDRKGVVILDFGNCGTLSENQQSHLIGLLIYLNLGLKFGVMRTLGNMVRDKEAWKGKEKGIRKKVKSIIGRKDLTLADKLREIKKELDAQKIAFEGSYEILFKFFDTVAYILGNLSQQEIANILKGVIKERYVRIVKRKISALAHKIPIGRKQKERKLGQMGERVESSETGTASHMEGPKPAEPDTGTRAGYENKDNMEYTPQIRTALGLDANGNLIEDAERNFVCVKYDEKGVKIVPLEFKGSDNIVTKIDGKLAMHDEEIEALTSILKNYETILRQNDLTIVLIPGISAHYGRTRSQIYLNRDLLNTDNPKSIEDLKWQIYHELQEKTGRKTHAELISEELKQRFGVDINSNLDAELTQKTRDLLRALTLDGEITQAELDIIIAETKKAVETFKTYRGEGIKQLNELQEIVAIQWIIKALEKNKVPGFVNKLVTALGDTEEVRKLIQELYDYKGYDNYFVSMINGIRTMFNTQGNPDTDKYLRMLDKYVMVKSKFNIKENKFISNGVEINDVLMKYRDMNRINGTQENHEALLSKVAEVVARYIADPDEILNLFENNAIKKQVKKQVKEGIDAIIRRKQLETEVKAKELLPGTERLSVGKPCKVDSGYILIEKKEGGYAISAMAEQMKWLLLRAKAVNELYILYDGREEGKGIISQWLGGNVNFVTKAEYKPEEDEEGTVVMLQHNTAERFANRLSKHRVVRGKADGEDDLMLMSHIAGILCREQLEGARDEFESLFKFYYNVKDIGNLDKDIKSAVEAVLSAIAKGGNIVITLPPIAPFIKPYYNSLKLVIEMVAKAA